VDTSEAANDLTNPLPPLATGVSSPVPIANQQGLSSIIPADYPPKESWENIHSSRCDEVNCFTFFGRKTKKIFLKKFKFTRRCEERQNLFAAGGYRFCLLKDTTVNILHLLLRFLFISFIILSYPSYPSIILSYSSYIASYSLIHHSLRIDRQTGALQCHLRA